MPPLKGELPQRYMADAVCWHCGVGFKKRLGCLNRAKRNGSPVYCTRECFGLSHRSKVQLTLEEKKALKSAYDAEYRAKNMERLRPKRAAYYQATRDPEREREYRKSTMARHVEYCQRPEYRAWKAEYDLHYRANKQFGEFAEAFLVLREIENEIDTRMSRTEIYQMNGTLNKSTQRKREYARTYSYKPEIGTVGNPEQTEGR